MLKLVSSQISVLPFSDDCPADIPDRLPILLLNETEKLPAKNDILEEVIPSEYSAENIFFIFNASEANFHPRTC